MSSKKHPLEIGSWVAAIISASIATYMVFPDKASALKENNVAAKQVDSIKSPLIEQSFPCEGQIIGYKGVQLNRVRFTPREDTLSREPVESGATVKIIEVNADIKPWYKISYNKGISGWIPAEYITPSKRCLK